VPYLKVPGAVPQSAGLRTSKCRVRTSKCRDQEFHAGWCGPQSAGIGNSTQDGADPKVPATYFHGEKVINGDFELSASPEQSRAISKVPDWRRSMERAGPQSAGCRNPLGMAVRVIDQKPFGQGGGVQFSIRRQQRDAEIESRCQLYGVISPQHVPVGEL
jgi:hypothetical protein